MADEKLTNAVPTSEPQSPASPPAVRDKRILPEGVVPKQAQGYVVAGLAMLILLAVMFSKNHAKPAPKETGTSPAGMSTDANQRKIQELEQDLSADQRQSQQQAQAQRTGTTQSPATAANAAQTGGAAPAAQLPPATEPPRDPVADAEKALIFKARFASNLVSAGEGVSRPATPPDGLRKCGCRHGSDSSLGLAAAGRCCERAKARTRGERQLRARPAFRAVRGNHYRHGIGESSGR